MDRRVLLLKAFTTLLEESKNLSSDKSILEQIIFYDDANCDGYCLLNDIRIELDLNNNNDIKSKLLLASKDLLEKQKNSSTVLNLLSETISYNDVICDGYSLLKHINKELDI